MKIRERGEIQEIMLRLFQDIVNKEFTRLDADNNVLINHTPILNMITNRIDELRGHLKIVGIYDLCQLRDVNFVKGEKDE